MLRYVRPDESIMFAPVSGSVDTTYLEAWLTDGEPGHPAVYTGDPSWTVTPAASLDVDLIAVHHTNLIETASVSISGSITASIIPFPVRPDGISPHASVLLDAPVLTSSLVLSITGNGAQTIIGGLYAGLSRTLPALYLGRHSVPRKVKPWEGEFSSLAPYAKGIGPGVPFTGTFILTESQLNDVAAWHQSQDEGNKPTIILPDYPVGVPMLVQFDYEYEDFAPGDVMPGGSPVIDHPEALFSVTMNVTEIPPIRWPA